MNNEDRDRVDELKDMMVPIIAVTSAIFLTVMAFTVPVLVFLYVGKLII